MGKLTSLMNIGTEMERKLTAVKIDTAEKLYSIGAKEAYFQLKLEYPEVCLVHLYTLQGAIDNTPYNMLLEKIKADLKAYSDTIK